jgi:predicted nuclease with TOPRIM domain
MINLNKEQIDALTNNIYNQIYKAANEKQETVKKNIMNTEKFKTLFGIYEDMRKRYKRIEKEFKDICEEYTNFCTENGINKRYADLEFDVMTKTEFFIRYCDSVKISFINSINKQDIKDDIIISTIDANDVDSIIAAVNKYLN